MIKTYDNYSISILENPQKRMVRFDAYNGETNLQGEFQDITKEQCFEKAKMLIGAMEGKIKHEDLSNN